MLINDKCLQILLIKTT
uniref:Uncharacterized protein n=1 Tax=Arundo donax TaxID=35708 RepID=A0A0A9CLH8_ARUDO